MSVALSSDQAGRLLNADEVAEIIGMRVDYVYALSRRGQIPHLRFGRTLRFRSEAIEAWLRAAERGTLARSKSTAGAPPQRRESAAENEA